MINKESAQTLDEFSKAISSKEGVKWSDYQKIQNIKKEDISMTKAYIETEIKRIKSLPTDQQTDLQGWEGYRTSIDTIETKWKEGTLIITQHKEENYGQTTEKTKAKLTELFGIITPTPVTSAPTRPTLVSEFPPTGKPTPPAPTKLDIENTNDEIVIPTPQDAIITLNTTFADKKFDMKNFGKSFEKSCETVEFYNAVATLVGLNLIQRVDQCTPIHIRTLRAATQTLQDYLDITEDGAFGPETLKAYKNPKNAGDIKEFLALTPAQKLAKGFHSVKKNTVVPVNIITTTNTTVSVKAPIIISGTNYSHEGNRTGTISVAPARPATVSGPAPAPAPAAPAPAAPAPAAPAPAASVPAASVPAKQASAQAPAASAPTKPATVSAPAQTTKVPTSAPAAVAPAAVASSTVIKATSAQASIAPASALKTVVSATKQTPASAPAASTPAASTPKTPVAQAKPAPAPAPAKPASAPQKTPEALPQGLLPKGPNIYQDTNFTYTLSEKTCTITKNNNSKIDIIINDGKINLLEPIKEFLLKQGIATVKATKEGLTVTSTITSV